VEALGALAQDSRLGIFQLLVRAGADGLKAGRLAVCLDLAPSSISFHFDRLRNAELVSCHRRGRSIIYVARFDTIDALLSYLARNCCEQTLHCGSGERPSRAAVVRTRVIAAPRARNLGARAGHA
jgi:ArsR family transcriptional regulator, arsenate/arsenite/antimonite-responsive transcriptional repressor